MVSEPNIVLGIKQKSLASKEDSHVHITVRSHTCLSAGSRLHSISQLPWLTAVFRSSSPSNPCLSLSDLCTSSLCLSKPTLQTCSLASREEKPKNPVNRKLSTRRHTPQLASENLPRAASDSSLPDRLLGTRAAQTALSSTDLLGLRIWRSYEVSRASTCHLGLWHLLHAPMDLARTCHTPKHCC